MLFILKCKDIKQKKQTQPCNVVINERQLTQLNYSVCVGNEVHTESINMLALQFVSKTGWYWLGGEELATSALFMTNETPPMGSDPCTIFNPI